MYKSARFLAIIEANLDVLAGMPDVEVLVSDRHGLDDTLERLRSRYGADPRFRFFAATDGIGWVAHYNWLLAQGRGAYFAWMPHDDTFPPGHYARLAEHLDTNPDTLLAFGPLIGVDENEQPLEWTLPLQSSPQWSREGGWNSRDSYRMLNFRPWLPFRGVFRREPIARVGLTVPTTLFNESADIGWMFAVGLLGAVTFVSCPPCTKRYYAESTHRTTMPYSFRSSSSVYAVMLRHAFRYSPSTFAAMAGAVRLARMYAERVVLYRVKRKFSAWTKHRLVRRPLAG